MWIEEAIKIARWAEVELRRSPLRAAIMIGERQAVAARKEFISGIVRRPGTFADFYTDWNA